MNKILVICGHPNIENSHYNKFIMSEFNKNSHITSHQLKANFDVKKEQDLLLEHNTIIYQFPLWWYSFPALLKDYFDKVMAWGFAYGENGDKLKNKKIMFSITTGGPKDAYTTEGYNKVEIDNLIIPMSAIFNLTQSNMLKPFVIQGCNPNPQSQISQKDFEAEVEKLMALANSM